MKSIPAGKFKATCLDLLDKVKENREEYVITKRGVPFAKLTPVEPRHGDPVGWTRSTISDRAARHFARYPKGPSTTLPAD
jgi:prevent-host-death family protein